MPPAPFFCLLSHPVPWPFEPFVVKDIRVEGIQRTEAGTVFSYLPVKVGDTMTDETRGGGDPCRCMPPDSSRMCG